MKILKNENCNKSVTTKETRGKHDANLRKNSTLYFQIGLILCLLGAYAALDYNFEAKKLYTPEPLDLPNDQVFYVTPVVEINRDVAKLEPKKAKPKLIIEPEIIDNDDTDAIETKEFVETITKDVPKNAKVVTNAKDFEVEKPEFIDPIPVAFVQNVPVYPGCESATNNKERITCMSNKLAKLVQNKFNVDIAYENGLTGKQRIFIQFKINKNGEVTLVKTQAPHAALEKEAKKLTTKIPNMKPGLQNNTPVDVLYTLPILFDVQN